MDYEEEYEKYYRRYDEYRTISNPRAFHLHDYLHRFCPWWEDNRSHRWVRRSSDKYKSKRKGRC